MSGTSARVSRHPTRAVLLNELRLFAREPVGLVWGLVVPVVAFVVMGCVPGLRERQAALGGSSYLTVYEPVIILFSLTILALNGIPPILGSYRERGVLRRLQTTPMPPSRLLGALLVIHLAVAVTAAALVLTIGAVAFGVPLPRSMAGWTVAYLLGCAAMLGLGVLVAAVTPTSKLANSIGAVLTFPLLFFAGLWMPRALMPDLLGTISDYTPLGAAVRGLSTATAGQLPALSGIAVSAAYALVLITLATRLFRWQ